MTMKVAVQMDPLEGVNPNGDTTFAMMEEAQARDRKEAALSAERDAARDRLARVEAENRALRAWIHQLNAPPAQMALKQPMMGMGVALVPRDAVPVSE